jgi:predicted amidohydrolase
MKIGIVQICSGLEYLENLEKIKIFLIEAKSKSIEAVFLPECFYSMSDGTKPSPYLINGENEHYQQIKNLAIEFGGFILGGSAACLDNGIIKNRNYNFDGAGNDLGHYDKINLFSCDITKNGERKKINEADIYAPGTEPKIINVNDKKLGLSICFDLRFPKMYLDYVEQGVDMISISSAFTIPTGKAHWHTLVKARAIESQCFVIAAAQWGKHNERIQTYGHSLIVDPWGKVLADAKEGEKLITADLNFERLEEVRNMVHITSK